MKPYLVNGLGSPQSIYDDSTTQYHAIGTKGTTDDGRVFYYSSYSGAALGRGNLCTVAASVSNHTSVAWASGGAAGSNTVTVTLGATAATANQYADGWLTVIDGTTTNGQGQIRKIRTHPAADSAATLQLTLYDTLETTMAASEVSLKVNTYANVIQSPGNAQPIPVGVPQFDVASGTATTQYLWLQTYGEGLVIGDGSTFADGSPVVPASAGTADAGQVTLGHESAGSGTANDPSDLLPCVGYIIEASDAASDGDHRFVMLTIRS